MRTIQRVIRSSIPVALQQQLDTVAQAMERSRAWVITQALEHFVAGQAWQVEEIHKALAEADAGDCCHRRKKLQALNTTIPIMTLVWLRRAEEDTMEFHTEREEALYTTLKQVLQNHVSNHRLGYHETLSACVSVLGYVLYVMSDDLDEAPGLIESTVAELKQRTHARVLACAPGAPDLP